MPGRCRAGQLNAANCIPKIKETARLSSASVIRQQMSNSRLSAEPIQDRAKYLVIIEPINESFVQCDFVSYGSIHHALIKIRGAKPPDLAREHHIVAIVDL